MVDSGAVVCRRFVGRKRELAAIAARCDAAAGGEGSVVLVSGEAGIGKSRFLAEARAGIERDGGRFVLGQCLQHAQSPLGPLVESLQALNAARGSVLNDAVHVRAALSRLLPELSASDRPDLGAGQDRRSQYAALLEALRRFGIEQPSAVAIEDAHWADLTTLEFLPYFAERILDARLTLIVTYRTDELHRDHPLIAALGKLSRLRGTHHLPLGPLADGEMRMFVAETLAGRTELGASRIGAIIDLAEGSPLFAEELLRHGVESADRRETAGELPLSIRAAVLQRTAALDDDDRSTLGLAAVVGRRFNVELLASLTGHSANRIAATLHRARDLQLIFEERSPRGSYAFRHALVQEALYSELVWDEVRPLHERIARELEALPRTPERVMELAYHWWAAHDRERSASYNEAAGDIAAQRLALADAARFYERALEFAPEDEAAQAPINVKLARTLSAFQPGEQARLAFERSIAYFERVGDRPRAAELLLDLGRFEWRTGAQLETRRRALDVIAPLPDHWVRFGVLTETACWYTLVADPDTAEAYLRQATPLAGAPKLRYLAHYHTICARLALLRGTAGEMAASHERAIQLAHETVDIEELCSAYGAAAWGALQVGNIGEARRRVDAAIRIAKERFLNEREAVNLVLCALLELLVGDLERSRAWLRASTEVGIDSERPYIRIHQASIAALLAFQTEDETLIERFVQDELVETAFSTEEACIFVVIAASFAKLYAARGQRERAAALLNRAVTKIRSIGWYPALAIEVALHADAPTVAAVRNMLQRWAQPADNRAGEAYLALFDALQTRRTGSDASRPATRAAQRFAEIGFPYYEALALEAGGRPKEALEIFRRIGDVADTCRLEAVLEPVNRRGRAKSQLTERENEIAAFVADGKSNRAIAELLSLSERTVESHVASILGKLNMASRAEIAARFRRQQTGTPI